MITPVPKPAPPPVVNAWGMRKNTPPPTADAEGRGTEAAPAPALQFGTVTAAIDKSDVALPSRMPRGDDAVKIAKQKKLPVSAPPSSIGVMKDATAWPDVAQAADKVAEEKKEKVKEKKGSEESSVVDDASSSSSVYRPLLMVINANL